jgi:hypothetical protein
MHRQTDVFALPNNVDREIATTKEVYANENNFTLVIFFK